ncbi:hypothetical protein [Streptomyces sp. NPDC052127]|uniref:hypothetical protein n=1 Tax=Streptomyces sp. NPDC052127 TaxID=3155679 RepID=UPI003435E459
MVLKLLSYGTGRWDLLVIPPETGPEAAARLMAAASEYGGPPLTASGLITADRAPHDASMPNRARDAERARESEGGASQFTAAVPNQASRLIIGR